MAKKIARRKNKKTGQLSRKLRTSAKVVMRTVKWVAPIALLILVALSTHNWLLTTQRFALQGILVNPCEHVDAKKLLKFLDVRLGENLLSFDLVAMQQRIEGHHWIKDVRITRRLPDTLVITIDEYQPYAMLNLGKLYYVDETGFPFKTLTKNDSRDFPILTGFSAVDFREEDAASKEKAEILKTAVQLVKTASDLGALRINQISEVRFDPLTGFSLVLEPKGMQVRLGTSQFTSKLRRLLSIRERLGQSASELTQVDLVNPEQAVIKGFREVNKG